MEKFVIAHPSYKLAETCLDLVFPQTFWSISDQYPDLVTGLHVQIRLMGNFGFSACVPWTIRTDESLCCCFFVKKLKTTYIIFFLTAYIFVRILIHFGQIWM